MAVEARRELPSRRRFLSVVGRGSAAVACTATLPWAAGCASVPRVSALHEGTTATLSAEDFAEGPGVLFEHPTEGLPVYVHRHTDGRYTAVLTRCSHRGCEVEPVVERLVCPCHGSEYDLDGTLRQGPADRSLVRYPVTSHQGNVIISLGGDGDLR